MIHLAATMFYTLSLLTACVLGHMAVRNSWREIVSALRGELGREIRQSEQLRAAVTQRRAAV